MRVLTVLAAAAAWTWIVTSVPCRGQTYHDAQYLAGGFQSSNPSPGNVPGIWVVRADGTAATVALPGFTTPGFCMDVDNRHVIVSCAGTVLPGYAPPQYGIYRFDPATLTYTTMYGPDTVTCNGIYNLHINQDGDYVFNAATGLGSSHTYAFKVYKLRFGSGLTTLLTSQMLGQIAYPWGAITTDIDTGYTLVSDVYSTASYHYPIYSIAPDGTVATWSHGIPHGWDGLYQLPRNHLNGFLEAPQNGFIYQLKPGAGQRTTLATIQVAPASNWTQRNFQFDLQSAPGRRWVGSTAPGAPASPSTWIQHIDPGGRVTSIHVRGVGARYLHHNDFDFYRGNHIQTLFVGPHQWQILLSCPRSPGSPYILAAGASGVRPGVKIPDGRRIHLNLDPLAVATAFNQVPGIWHPGPGVLDSQGEARGLLDLRPLKRPPGGFGIPIWIALLVLDPLTPTGIKYIPDTWVMRI